MTAPRVRWEVRSDAPEFNDTSWSTPEAARNQRDAVRRTGRSAWIVKVTTLPKRVSVGRWQRGSTVVEHKTGSMFFCILRNGWFLDARGTLPGDARSQALALLDEYAPRKAGAR